MKLFIKIVVNIFLFLGFLIPLFFSSSFTGPRINLILSILILAALIVYNIKANEKFTPRIKKILLIVLFIGCLTYLAVPKKNIACGVPACSLNYCVGLPATGFVIPICFGYAFGEKTIIN